MEVCWISKTYHRKKSGKYLTKNAYMDYMLKWQHFGYKELHEIHDQNIFHLFLLFLNVTMRRLDITRAAPV